MSADVAEIEFLEEIVTKAVLDPNDKLLFASRYVNIPSSTPKSPLLLADKSLATAVRREHRPHQTKFHPPKIAICISGQLRGFRQAAPKVKKFARDVGADIFVHTWSDVGNFGDEVTKLEALSRLPDLASESNRITTDINWACQRFQQALAALDKYRVEPSDVAEFYSARAVVVDDGAEFQAKMVDHFHRSGISMPPINQLKLFYKIWSCNQLANQTDDYDVIVRLRPDLGMDRLSIREMLATSAEEMAIAGSYFLAPEYHGFSDQFAFGSLGVMEVYSQIWPKLLDRGRDMDVPGLNGGLEEAAIFYQLFSMGAKMRLARENRATELFRAPDVFSGVLM
jgi:hypothetical protein